MKNEREQAIYLVTKFGVKIALEIVTLVLSNHPHEIVGEKGNFRQVSNSLFWKGVENEILSIEYSLEVQKSS